MSTLLSWMYSNLSRPLVIEPYVVKDAGLIILFEALFCVEIATTTSGVIFLVTLIVYRNHLKVHPNLRYIITNAALQFALFAPSRLFAIWRTLDWNRSETIDNDVIFRIAETFRTHYQLVGGFLLPAVALERTYSNAYICDYEATSRTHISIVIISVINVVSSCCAILTILVGNMSPVVPYALVVVANVFALLAYRRCHRRTMYYYRTMLERMSAKAQRSYSLSARFQCVENIRVRKLFRRMYLLASLLVGILIVTFAVALCLPSRLVDAFCTQAFLFGVLIYANVFPLVFLAGIPAFRQDIRKIRAHVRRRRSMVDDEDVLRSAVNGAKLSYSPEEEAKVYFSQLERMWS